jgi:hypothetical protein
MRNHPGECPRIERTEIVPRLELLLLAGKRSRNDDRTMEIPVAGDFAFDSRIACAVKEEPPPALINGRSKSSGRKDCLSPAGLENGWLRVRKAP